MSRSIWIPLLGGALLQAGSVIVVTAIPECAPRPVLQEVECTAESPPTEPVVPFRVSGLHMERLYKTWLRQAKSSLNFVFRDKAIAALIWAMPLFEIGYHSKNILPQYASKRYDWTLAQVSLASELPHNFSFR